MVTPRPSSNDISAAVMLDYAKAYARSGYSIFPLHTATWNRIAPLISWRRFRSERAGEAEIQRWFRKWPITAIAAVLGQASTVTPAGETCVVCRHYCDFNAYQQWAGMYPEQAKELPTVASGDGFHVFARTSVAYASCVQLVLGARPPAGAFLTDGPVYLQDGAFLGGPACYAVLPPSIGAGGVPYRWIGAFANAPPMVDEIPLSEDLMGFCVGAVVKPTGNAGGPE